MLRISYRDDEPQRCAYERCNRKLRGFGFVQETTGSIFCNDICAVQDETEKAPRALCLQ
jgi:hypothetical protein